MKKPLLAALAAATISAAAQDAPPIVVLYQPAHGRNAYLVDDVMEKVLQTPSFVKAAKADAQTLVVTVPDKAALVSSSGDIPFSFTLDFARNGDALGEAEEECSTGQMAACASQVASDLTSAAAIHH